MQEVFVGIDQSLTGTGLVLLNKKGDTVVEKLIKTKPGEFDSDIERLLHIKNKIKEVILKYEIIASAIEGFGFSCRGQAIFQIAGLGYLIRELFYENGWPLIIVPPTVLKKFVCGKGNAKKDLMLLEVYKKWGISFTDDNLCDAFSLAKYCENEYNISKEQTNGKMVI